MEGIEGISSSGGAYTNALNINSSIVEGRRNFARPAEALAEAGTPGFEEYLSAASETKEAEPAFPCLSAKANPKALQMSYEDSDFGFDDVVDLLNPLQHIPIISSLYHYAFGEDEIKPSTQVAGDMLYGGVLGGVFAGGLASVANSIIEQETGTSIDQEIVQALIGPSETEEEQPKTTMLADASAEASKAVPLPAPTAESIETSKPAASEDKLVVADSSANNNLLPGMRTKAKFNTVSSKKTADAAEVAPLPAPTNNVIPERQPFGGVMDTSTIKSSALSKNNGNAVLVGGSLYSSSKFNNLGGVSKPQTSNNAAKAPTAPTASIDDPSQLGKVMHENANKATVSSQAGAKGNALPPELVKDMMLMALDKYKTAESLGKPAQTAGITQPLTGSDELPGLSPSVP